MNAAPYLRINMARVDRVLRAVAGVALLTVPTALSLAHWLIAPLAAVGAAQILAAATGYCITYDLWKGRPGPRAGRGGPVAGQEKERSRV
jgi:hypothetical protein